MSSSLLRTASEEELAVVMGVLFFLIELALGGECGFLFLFMVVGF
ncbi:hypothetical protein A2U01_0084223, partial [Trifolium medium]|nr:hypothetical protein [Trifolium medium]